jgi:hypothetical protein
MEVTVPPNFFEGCSKHLGQLFGVNAAVMDGGRFFETLLIEGKLSRDRALDLVVVAGARVAVIA